MTMTMTEEWRAVVGFEGYEVSDLGRVRSWRQNRKGFVLKQVATKFGHKMVFPSGGGSQVAVYVHRLVLQAFVGPSAPLQECRHLDGVPGNNRLGNLMWGTSLENAADRTRHGTHASTKKLVCPRCGRGYSRSKSGRVCTPCKLEKRRIKYASDPEYRARVLAENTARAVKKREATEGNHPDLRQ